MLGSFSRRMLRASNHRGLRRGDLGFDYIISNGVADEGSCRMEVEFEHDARTVAFHTPSADIENGANLLAGFAIGQEAEDLPLARAAPEKLNQSKPEFSEREAVG